MNDSEKPDIFILVADEDTAARCSQWLDGLDCRVCLYETAIPDDVGVVVIGGDDHRSADVHLPPDCSRRELCTAARLLAEIVRLRRRAHSADRVGRHFKRAALTDPLTELPNRRHWQAALEERLTKSREAERRLCLAVVDLDRFKTINDAHGHSAGDCVLKQVADAIRGSIREDDFAARLGGDEFGLLFWAPDSDTARNVVERVRAGIGSRRIEQADLYVTASAGFTLVTPAVIEEANSAEMLFKAADDAMHRAKRFGRDRTEYGEAGK